MSVQVVAQTLGSGGNLVIAVGLCNLLPVICPNHLKSRGTCSALDIERALLSSKTGVAFAERGRAGSLQLSRQLIPVCYLRRRHWRGGQAHAQKIALLGPSSGFRGLTLLGSSRLAVYSEQVSRVGHGQDTDLLDWVDDILRLLHRPLREGRQSVQILFDLMQEQFLQRPLPLHRQQMGIAITLFCREIEKRNRTTFLTNFPQSRQPGLITLPPREDHSSPCGVFPVCLLLFSLLLFHLL